MLNLEDYDWGALEGAADRMYESTNPIEKTIAADEFFALLKCERRDGGWVVPENFAEILRLIGAYSRGETN